MAEKTTCLHDRHVSQGAKMVSFGGFEMPIQYTDITAEHQAVRQDCGVFDVSHMGEALVTGPQAESYVQHIFTNDISGAAAGKIFYGMMLYPNGGTVDDLLVYKLGENNFLLVINAANIDKDLAWMTEQAAGYEVSIKNQSDDYGQLAIQGPHAELVMEQVLQIPCSELAFYTFKTLPHQGESIIVSRTGYTGEDGFEIYGSHDFIRQSWDTLMASGRAKPCGLGCRDTLRFEVGLPLYGDELTDSISPIMAGLGIFVKTDKPDFIGRDAILRQKAEGVKQKIVGIELQDRAIPRHGYEVVDENGQAAGTVTTGYLTPSTGKSVCMALVNADSAQIGTPVQVRIHRKLHKGTVVKKRFYQKHYKK